jgi:hypothetical protein
MFEEQQLFLQVWGKVEQAEDLAHAGSADTAQPSRRSIAADRSRANQLFDMPSQRHQPCDNLDRAADSRQLWSKSSRF